MRFAEREALGLPSTTPSQKEQLHKLRGIDDTGMHALYGGVCAGSSHMWTYCCFFRSPAWIVVRLGWVSVFVASLFLIYEIERFVTVELDVFFLVATIGKCLIH